MSDLHAAHILRSAAERHFGQASEMEISPSIAPGGDLRPPRAREPTPIPQPLDGGLG
jgi:hypothetical protein